MAKKKTTSKPETPVQFTPSLDDPVRKLWYITPTAIKPSPFQPRREFPKDEIEALAKSLKEYGQLVPITVREGVGGDFELIFGERRLRAVKMAGLTKVIATVVKADDTKVRSMILVEALQKKNLNPIEEGWAFLGALNTGVAATQIELAKQLGVSQGRISNHIRLLELPEWWQKKIISREIIERHARAVLPFKDCPKIMEALEEEMESELLDNGAAPNVANWEAGMVSDVVMKITRTMVGIDGEIFDQQRGRRVPLFTPTDEQLEELQIVELDGERRAANVELWDRLQEGFLRAAEIRISGSEIDRDTRSKAENDEGPEEEEDCEGNGLDSDDPEVGEEAEVMPDESGRSPIQKAAKAPEPDSPSASAKDFPSRLWAWKVMAMRKALWEYLKDVQCHDAEEIMKIAILAIGRWDEPVKCCLPNVLRAAGVRKNKDLCLSTFELSPLDAENVLGSLLSHYFWDENGAVIEVPQNDVSEVFEELGLFLMNSWDDGTIAYPQGYWELHTKEQLLAIAKEVKVLDFFRPEDLDALHLTQKPPTVDGLYKLSKANLIEMFMRQMPQPDGEEDGIPMPKEISRAKAPK